MNLFSAAFFAFAAVTTIGEEITNDEPIDWGFLAVFGGTFSLLAAYLGYCGWRRIRWSSRQLREAVVGDSN
ncbi:hypothetical protein CGZ80_11270 [Rhodopirellula sp. MGV]|nr:hypothetical protein CGZ80_11270 [Rhodopirellula sp. MGV]PNY33862.1 hypothetical protein C2E31_25890 [Rhodopirellula baltica]